MSAIHISLAAEEITRLAGWPITNAMLTGFIGSVVIITIFWLAATRIKLHPGGQLTLTIESMHEAILDQVQDVTGDRAKARQLFPLLMTFFIFILINNWLGILPGVGSITVNTPHGTFPLLRGSNADLNTTLALALISVVMTHVYAIQKLGVWQHVKKYFHLNPIMMFVGLLELVQEFSRVISFAFRLFGNIFAGEVLLIVIAFLVPFLGPVPFFALEIFVGFIQALVFTILTLVFIEIATSHHKEAVEEIKTNH